MLDNIFTSLHEYDRWVERVKDSELISVRIIRVDNYKIILDRLIASPKLNVNNFFIEEIKMIHLD